VETAASPYEQEHPEAAAAVGGELDPERIIRARLPQTHLQHIEPALEETLECLARVTLQRGSWP
jgi:hypothetical protein